MINQSRYIISAFLILLFLVAGLFISEKLFVNVKRANQINIVNTDILPDNDVSKNKSAGMSLFADNCASCHSIFKTIVGPALANFEKRGPWNDRKKLYAWIHNPAKFMSDDVYTKSLRSKYGISMTSFPDLRENDIDAIANYINLSSGPIPVASP